MAGMKYEIYLDLSAESRDLKSFKSSKAVPELIKKEVIKIINGYDRKELAKKKEEVVNFTFNGTYDSKQFKDFNWEFMGNLPSAYEGVMRIEAYFEKEKELKFFKTEFFKKYFRRGKKVTGLDDINTLSYRPDIPGVNFTVKIF